MCGVGSFSEERTVFNNYCKLVFKSGTVLVWNNHDSRSSEFPVDYFTLRLFTLWKKNGFLVPFHVYCKDVHFKILPVHWRIILGLLSVLTCIGLWFCSCYIFTCYIMTILTSICQNKPIWLSLFSSDKFVVWQLTEYTQG